MMKLLLSLLTVLLSARCALAALNNDFQPIIYNVSMQPGTAAFNSITCTSKMTLTCINPTDTVNLNWGSNISPYPPTTSSFTATMQPDERTYTSTPVSITSVTVDNQGVVIVKLGTTMAAGNILNITTHSSTSCGKDPSNGMHYVQYSYGNVPSYIIIARPWPQKSMQMFPGMDGLEGYSAIMNVTMTLPSSWSSASSLPKQASVTDANAGTTTVVYNSTDIRLPPSLTGFVMGSALTTDEVTDPRTSTKFIFLAPQGWTPSALTETKQYLTSLMCVVENILGMPWPGKTVSVVLVPNQAATLSTYGIILIRNDSYVMGDGSPQSEGVFNTKIREFIKQFIMMFTRFSSYAASWPDAWIGEALAGYLTQVVLYTLSPQYDPKTYLEVEALQQSVTIDIAGSSPLQNTNMDVSSTAAIELALMDPLKALKGPSLINMLDQFFPAGSLFNGILALLRQNPAKPVNTAGVCTHLSNFISNSGGYVSADALRALNSICMWFSSADTVMLNASIVATGNPGTVNVAVRPYCQVPPCTNTAPAYYISVALASRSEPRTMVLRTPVWVTPSDSGSTTSIRLADNDWLDCGDSRAHCVANYTPPVWQSLIDAIPRKQNGNYEIMGRSKLMFNAFTLAFQGSLSFDIPLRLTAANIAETLYKNWYPVRQALDRMKNSLWGLPQYAAFKTYMGPFVDKVHALLQGGTLDSYEQARIYALFLPYLCEYNAYYRNLAAGNLTYFLLGQQPTTMPSSAYEATICCGAKYSSNVNANWMWNNITDASYGYSRQHNNAIGLACHSNYTLITTYFPSMMSADISLKPLITTIFLTIAAEHGYALTANLSTIIVDLVKQVGAPNAALVIEKACKKVNNNTQAAYLTGIASANVDNVVKTAATNCMSSVTVRVSTIFRTNSSMVAAMKANSLGPNTPSAAAPVTLLSLILLVIPFIPVLTTF